MKMLYGLYFIKFDCHPIAMHQDDDPYNQFYLMGDDEDDTNDLWDEYYNKRVIGQSNNTKTQTKPSPKVTADKNKYPHKCPYCGSASYNDPVFGRVDCSKCDGKGNCKNCKCDTGECDDKGSCSGCN